MNIVFLGNIVSLEDVEKYSAGSVAGNKMQYYLLKYLSQIDGVNIEVISSFSHACFPKDKKIFIRREEQILFDKVKVHQLSYVNLPIIKQLMLIIKTRFYTKRLCRKYDSPIVFAYDLYPPQGNALRKVSSFKNVKTLSLLADLSIGGVQKKRGIKKFLQKLYDKATLKNIKSCQNYIVLNEELIKAYASGKNYIVVQGGVEPLEFPLDSPLWDGKVKNIVYTGALVYYSGIMTLINAMKHLKDREVVLDIYGSGPLESQVRSMAETMPNVVFHGTKSNKEILKIQRSCWLLINPRPVDNNIAKVTFPSKIFEYMMSERPILSTKLNGFTEEYKDKIFWAEDDTATELAKSIENLANSPAESLNKVAKTAKDFVTENCSWDVRVDSIFDFLNNNLI